MGCTDSKVSAPARESQAKVVEPPPATDDIVDESLARTGSYSAAMSKSTSEPTTTVDENMSMPKQVDSDAQAVPSWLQDDENSSSSDSDACEEDMSGWTASTGKSVAQKAADEAAEADAAGLDLDAVRRLRQAKLDGMTEEQLDELKAELEVECANTRRKAAKAAKLKKGDSNVTSDQ